MSQFQLVVYWYGNDWGLFGRRHEMLTRTLARQPEVERVLHIEQPVDVSRAISLWRRWRREKRREVRALLALRLQRCLRIQPLDEAIVGLTPVRALRHNSERYMIARCIDQTIVARQWDRIAQWAECSARPVVLLLYPPAAFGEVLVERLRPALVIADVVDDVRTVKHLTDSKRKDITRRYQVQLARADLAMAVTSRLTQSLALFHSKIELVPNAVDLDAFRVPVACPPELAALPRPIAGYVGFMRGQRLDAELVAAVAERRPQVSFVFVGEMHPIFLRTSYRPLVALPNIHFLGHQPAREMAAFIQHFDVGLMPHRSDDFSASANPLKLYQYLAAGKPVLATPVAGTEAFGDLVATGWTADEWVQQLDGLLAEGTSRAPQRRAVVEPHSWLARSRYLIEQRILPALALRGGA